MEMKLYDHLKIFAGINIIENGVGCNHLEIIMSTNYDECVIKKFSGGAFAT